MFRPERWLIDDVDRVKEMMKVQELIFGYGTPRCLGIPIAMMNLNKIIVEVSFRCYFLFSFRYLLIFSEATSWDQACEVVQANAVFVYSC